MKTNLLAIFLISAAAAWSQSNYNGYGYVFYGAGRIAQGGDSIQHVGGGAEGFLFKGLAAGAELGYLFPTGYANEGFGTLSLNGSYHFTRRANAKIAPFVTAGYTLAFRTYTANMANFGGGVIWWMSRHVGVRAEVRDYRMCCEDMPVFHIGLSFR